MSINEKLSTLLLLLIQRNPVSPQEYFIPCRKSMSPKRKMRNKNKLVRRINNLMTKQIKLMLKVLRLSRYKRKSKRIIINNLNRILEVLAKNLNNLERMNQSKMYQTNSLLKINSSQLPWRTSLQTIKHTLASTCTSRAVKTQQKDH